MIGVTAGQSGVGIGTIRYCERAGLERLEAALLGLLEGCREDRPDCALLRALMRPPAPGIR